MDENSQDDIISLVNSIFDVSDFIKTEFSMEFQIEDIEFKSKFEKLARKLEGMSFACRLEQKDGGKFHYYSKVCYKKTKKMDEDCLDAKNSVCNCNCICND